jgi:hypothetical protein
MVLWRAGLRIQEALALAQVDVIIGARRCSCVAEKADAAARSAFT